MSTANMRRRFTLILGFVASALVAACSQPGTAARASRSPAPAPYEARTDAPAAADAQPTPRQMIRRGRIAVTAEHLSAAQRRLERAAAALGAETARSEAHQDEWAEYLFRVPPERLEALMDSAAVLGTAEGRTVSAEDVTGQVVDVEGRLVALRASRDRLRQLMERSASVSDVVTVERELARVQGELESLEGRLEALRGQVARSELTVRLRQRHILGPLGVVAVGLGRLIAKLFVWR